MSMFKNLASDSSIANERDSVGGSRVIESGLYPFDIALAYGITSGGGAMGLVVGLKSAEGKELRQTLWMTSGTAKGCKNFYMDKQNQKQYLPGYLLANSLCLLTVGKEISDLDTEEKVISVYSPEAKAEVPTKVNMLVDLLGKPIFAGVIKQVVDKTKKDEAGEYQPTGETREENEIDKFFRARDRMTTAEIRAQATEAAFADTWSAKWTGVTRERATKVAGTAGAPKGSAFNGTAKPAAAAGKPAASLFG